jgi:hypothetical protein
MAQVTCPNGHPNRAGAKFCSVCRAQIVAFAQPPVAATFAEQPNRRRWIIPAAAGIIILFIVAALLIVFWPTDKDDQEEVVEVEATVTVETLEESSEPPPTVLPVVTATLEPEEEEEMDPVEESPTPVVEPAAPLPGNLLINGEFFDNWDNGWQRVLGENATGSQRIEVIDLERGVAGQGVHIERDGPDALQLEQTVPVDPAHLYFQADVRLIGSIDTAMNAEGMAILMLVYRNEEQTALGYSIWLNGPQRVTELFGRGPLPLVGNNVSRRWLGDEWHTIHLDLRQEVINSLPVVNVNDVRYVTVMLLGMGSESCMPDSCLVNIQATNLRLSQE